MIIREGRFHGETIKEALKLADTQCKIFTGDESDGLLLSITVRPSSPDKAAILEEILDAHKGEAALAVESTKKDRIAKAPDDIRKIPGWGTWSAQEAADHIDANVNDILSAKVAMKNMAKIICYLRDHAGIV